MKILSLVLILIGGLGLGLAGAAKFFLRGAILNVSPVGFCVGSTAVLMLAVAVMLYDRTYGATVPQAGAR